MIVFPNCKVNLGLHITRKRADGYHDLETIFYPLPVTDALEIISPGTMLFNSSGISVPGNDTDNLCLKAYRLLQQDYPALPPVDIHLHKNIPIGAGLGGGSADAAFMLQLLNSKFQLNIPDDQLLAYAAILGSDCPFFIRNTPCYATSRGELLTPIILDLENYSFLLVHPGIHVNTGWAFSQITPREPDNHLLTSIQQPVEEWKRLIYNDFEEVVSAAHPVLREIKSMMYANGALYAAMSGSGSTMLGIFPKNKIAGILWDASYLVFKII